MKFEGRQYRSLIFKNDNLRIIDQTLLPKKFGIIELKTSSEIIEAIKEMKLRGAPLIGVAAAYAVYFAYRESFSKQEPEEYYDITLQNIKKARPTAVNLTWAADRIDKVIKTGLELHRVLSYVNNIENDEINCCRSIGEKGGAILTQIGNVKKSGRVNILTHCNAGWLATVEYGTASAPVFRARDNGTSVHVWIGETRPRNQGGKLTAWEYFHEKIPHTVVSDNSVGHLMQKGMVDIVITGADRIAKNGDTANKIGTYLRALAAKSNGVPFYIAAPVSTFDFSISSGREIEIEERDGNELKYSEGKALIHEHSPVLNHAFDVTPAELITGFITERGIFDPKDIKRLSL